MHKLGRNEPCWCRSGLKLKHCHGAPDRQESVPRSQILNDLKQAARQKRCLHFDAGTSTCAGKLVAAHTVQAKVLRAIARHGHVYQIDRDPTSLDSNTGKFKPRLTGIKKASTVFAFCQHHDSTTFRPIEEGDINSTPEHAALLGYRANCYELYAKEGAVLLAPSRRKWDSGQPLRAQVAFQTMNQPMNRGFKAGLDDIARANLKYAEILRSGVYDSVRYYAVWFDSPPDIMCAGGKNPQFDFDGRELQDWSDLTTPAQALYLSLVAAGDRGCAFFTWLESDDSACVPFVASLDSLPDVEIPHALVRMVFGHIENLYWRPDWWDGLFQETRDRLLARFMTGVHPLIQIPADFLCDDGMRVVRWHVTGRQTNVPKLERLPQPGKSCHALWPRNPRQCHASNPV